MKYIITPTGISLVVAQKPVRVAKTDRKYNEVLDVLSQGDALSDDEAEDQISAIISRDDIKQLGFAFNDGEVSFNGKILPKALADKLSAIKATGLPMDSLLEFFKKLDNNPSSSSVNELYDFLAYKELPITEDGCFIAYKGVGSDFYSKKGNKNTIVKSGVVDSAGRICNEVGAVVEVARNQVDDNRSEGCSYGLHVGSCDYASRWDTVLLAVKVDPADVVSVPSDHSFQKCRVCKYEVMYVVEEELTSPVTDDRGVEMDSSTPRRGEYLNAVEDYLDACDYGNEVAFRKIMEDVGVTRLELLDALQEHDYDYNEDEEYIILY